MNPGPSKSHEILALDFDGEHEIVNKNDPRVFTCSTCKNYCVYQFGERETPVCYNCAEWESNGIVSEFDWEIPTCCVCKEYCERGFGNCEKCDSPLCRYCSSNDLEHRNCDFENLPRLDIKGQRLITFYFSPMDIRI